MSSTVAEVGSVETSERAKPRRRPGEVRPRFQQATRNWTVPLAGTLVILALAELVVRVGLLSTAFLPAPTTIFGALIDELGTGEFWTALRDTLWGWSYGLGVAIAFAVPGGILIGSNQWLYRATRFVVDFIRPIPSIAILPVFMLVFGIGPPLKVYIAALAAFSPLFFQAVYGVQDVDPVARDTARAYRLSRFDTFRHVSLPGSTPYIATGLRLSASIALLLVVGTEMVVGLAGLGNNIIRAQYALDLPRMYALIVTSGILGILIASIFGRIERFFLRWHPSQVKEAAT